mmetsp:Transcript_866/g.1481  ORF Transcript_866/g.1481 Transcript_866/m.1481 type:complete len:423 (-) Transcript_866:257-1525(-)
MMLPKRYVLGACRSRVLRRFSSTPEDTFIYSWGKGSDGQLGHAKFTKTAGFMEESYIQMEPRKMVKSKRFKQCAIGDTFTLGITSTNDLFGWGKDFVDGQQSNEPVPIAPGLKVKAVSAGTKHAALVDMNGQVHTWGYGGGWMSGGGQLGHGNRDKVNSPKLVDTFQVYGASAAMVSCGHQHTAILTDDGEVLCCGVGEYGLQGTGSTDDALYPAPLDALENEDVVQISAGYDHTLALTATGSIYSWGRNNSGQLGHSDSYIDIYSMEDFPRLIDSESVKSSENEEALRAAGMYNESNAVFTQIAAGNARSAAITSDGLLFIWGARVGHQPQLLAPTLFDNLKVNKVAIGGDQGKSIFAILTEDGSLWTMGDSSSKLMGIPGLSGKQPVPLRVAALGDRVEDVACGYGHHMLAFAKMITADS